MSEEKDYTLCCYLCRSSISLKMYPQRNMNGEMVGWIFVCGGHDESEIPETVTMGAIKKNSEYEKQIQSLKQRLSQAEKRLEQQDISSGKVVDALREKLSQAEARNKELEEALQRRER